VTSPTPMDSSARGARTVTPSVETVLAFVNTRTDGGGRRELLGDAEAFGSWLADHGQFGGPTTVTGADAAAARELRDSLVTIMLAHSGDEESVGEPVRAAEAHLRRIGTLYPLATEITERGARLTSPQSGAAHVIGTVLAAVSEFALSGDWGRIKACSNPPCHFGFFDRTRNGSGLYCSTACSAQVSMRKYRQRQRNSS
jgi:predicted RNA-binding Zn ribbon-like protein